LTGSTGPTGPAGDSHWLLNGTATYYTAGNVGIGTNNPAYPLQVVSNGTKSLSAENGALTGFTFGVWGQSASTDGRGVLGWASASTGTTNGVWGESASPTGRGVLGFATATSGVNYGVWGESASTSGHGVSAFATATSGLTYGVWGQSSSTNGNGVFGWATATSGFTEGVRGQSASPDGLGVFGFAAASSGFTNGVWGQSASPDGRGVYGVATAGTGTTYGVFGATNSPSGYGVFSIGNTGATGTKSFVIDHPLDPENQYLKHYSAEGPEPQNIYNGTVLLDARGEAWVELPDYFAAINRDPRYTLTPVGAAMPNLHVAEEINFAAATSRFRIAGGRPGLKASWMVMTVRDDPYVHRYGAPVEVLKDAALRGTYLHPELYGQPRERAENYRDLPTSTEAVIDPAQAIAGDPRS